MKPHTSAGLLMYRRRGGVLEVLLAHPGGPFWAKKDLGAWSIPKGEVAEGEDLLAAAQREFEEETGVPPAGPFIPLPPITQKNGKIVHAWAFEGDCAAAGVTSNTFTMEWPRGSGRMREFPEVDRVEWLGLEDAVLKLLPAQAAFVRELASRLGETTR
jgi:predicted NUDIX family NTP pyrophosphohydrolase